MRIGYPCLNHSTGCSPAKTFRLASYSDDRLCRTVTENLACLSDILSYNDNNGIFFFRITSDIVPFASHPVCRFDWREHFAGHLSLLGKTIRDNACRISMHPDQFVLLNSPDENVVARSIAELEYHAAVLDLMGLDTSAKIQIHVGGVYGDRQAALGRFIDVYKALPHAIRRRLVIENDERLYPVSDCLDISKKIGVPVLFDSFHHAIFNTGESLGDLLDSVSRTWKPADGLMMIDYSSQAPGKRTGAHAEKIDSDDFRRFLERTGSRDMDIMLEIKDKEKSAREAIRIAVGDPRLYTGKS